MSMNGCFAAVRPEVLAELRADPDRAVRLAGGSGLSGLLGAVGPEAVADALNGCLPAPVSWACRLVPRRARVWLVARVLPVPDAAIVGPPEVAGGRDVPVEAELDVHKDWHALHWLLTGSADEVDGPLGDAILGGEPVGDEVEHDTGYGPVRALDPARVVAVHAALTALGHDGALGRWDRRAMQAAEVYGGSWGADDRASVSANLGRLMGFYERAAASGHAVLAWIS